MSNQNLVWLLLLQLFFILLNAVFACAEIAVITMNDKKLAKLAAAGDKRAIRLEKLTSQPARFLATIQVGITVITLLSSAVAAENFADRMTAGFIAIGLSLPRSVVHGISVALITIALTYFTVLLGELVPKRVALKNAERFALAMSGSIYGLSRCFAPVVWFFTASTNGVLRLLRIDPNGQEDENAEEEIRMILEAGKESGAIPPEERSMIQNVFEFNDISAGEIMTHRTEVILLWMDENDDQWRQTIYENRHSHYPLCGDSPDDIVGVLSSKDYFRLTDQSRQAVLEKVVRPAVFVPETVRADLLFRNMQRSRSHFAIVVDEYGGMSGIITMNDLLEQLVGELEDDLNEPKEPPMIEKLGDGNWRIQGIASLDDVGRELGLVLPDEDYETFGGLVFGLLGRVPADGSTPELRGFGMAIKVTEIKDRRLESAVVTLVKEKIHTS